MGYGFDAHVGVGFQESFGTLYTNSLHYIPIISESLVDGRPVLRDESMRGRLQPGQAYEGPYEVGGDIVFQAHPILVGIALKAVLGQSSGILTADSHYTHGFVAKATNFDKFAALPPMTFEVYRSVGSAQHYYDLTCNGLSLEIANGVFISVTMSMVGGKNAKVVKTTPSYKTGNLFTWDQASISLNAAGVDEIQSITIGIDNTLEPRHTLGGSKYPSRVLRTDRQPITISGVALYENDTELDKFRAGSDQRAVISITGPEISSGYNTELEFDIPSLRYTAYPPQVGGAGPIEASFEAMAEYNTGSGQNLEVMLVNTQSIY